VFSFVIVTDDLVRSKELYADAVGLDMRPLSNAVLMFPLGPVDFVVCLRDEAPELVEHRFDEGPSRNVLMMYRVKSRDKLRQIHANLRNFGSIVERNLDRPNVIFMEDFNSISWLIETD